MIDEPLRGGWPTHYNLVSRVPMSVDFMSWAKRFENADNGRVANTEISDACSVSTVLLGLDHNFFGRGDLVLFGTMIFGGPLDEQQIALSDWDEAEREHNEAVTQARKAIAQVDAIARSVGAKEMVTTETRDHAPQLVRHARGNAIALWPRPPGDKGPAGHAKRPPHAQASRFRFVQGMRRDGHDRR
jgi:hypothetical protein